MQTYLHHKSEDKRSSNQIALTEKLTSAITELNLARIKKSQAYEGFNAGKEKTSFNNQKILFVCITGIPAFQNEFINLNLPGQTLVFVLPGFQLDLNDDQLKERALKSDLNVFSQEIHQKIQTYPKDWPLVFVYHSFGTFVAVYYFKHFYEKEKQRIKGIIELGAAPIRFYKTIEAAISASTKMSKEFICENVDILYGGFNDLREKWKKQSGIVTLNYKSKYSLMSVFLSYKTEGFNQIFEMIRKLPKVLKLSIYGGKDSLFERKNLDQKAVFYLYDESTSLQSSYLKDLTKKYNQIHKSSPKNLQQKFIYKLEQGKHSLHMQKQLIPLIRTAIDEYLRIIF